MKPPPFAYADPGTVSEVLELLAEHGEHAAVLAGGQSLVPDLNFRRIRPRLVIDLGRVGGLADIVVDPHGVTVGAAVRVGDLAAAHPATGVAQAVGCIAHPQIRNRSTVGGNVSLGEPSAELPAVLVALDGQVTLRSLRGERTVDAGDWFTGRRQTVRRTDELVTAVRFGTVDGPSSWTEVARRPQDLPIVGLFVARHGDAWRVAAAGLGETPVRSTACEQALATGDLDAAVAALVDEVDPPSDHVASARHRRSIAASLLRSAIASFGLPAAA